MTRPSTSSSTTAKPSRKSTSAKQSAKPPWNKSAPKDASRRHLSPEKKASAKRAAKRAGRPYPNLVDNIRAAAAGRRAKRKGK